jgi:fructosamine-3-kinase
MESSLQTAIAESLQSEFGKETSITDFQNVGGGCINQTAIINTTQGNFFVKWNDKHLYPNMFVAEARGLELLAKSNFLKTPEVVTTGETEDVSFLILENIEQGKRDKSFWEKFGMGLANIHRQSRSQFGLDHDNYIGSLPQINDFKSDWPSFFIEKRLEKQIQLALDSGKIRQREVRLFDQLFKRIPTIFPNEKPALLHGDLWNGNYMVGSDGEPCIIDPAVYYGHREMDLGMTRLFGGFAPEFYQAYNEAFPLETGYEQRLDICNLYPLMVHVNLFGRGYWASVESILRRF